MLRQLRLTQRSFLGDYEVTILEIFVEVDHKIRVMAYLCTLPYWRKSLWNPFSCRPVVMMLEGQRLRAWDKSDVVLFDCPVTAVQSHLSRLRTLVLHIDGQEWSLIGRGAGSSPDPTVAQRDTVKRFLDVHSEAPLPTDMKGQGIADYTFNGSAGYHMRLWHQVLSEAGAQKV